MFEGMDYRLYTLNNGIRIVHKDNPHSNIVHSCVVINCGSRDERKGKEGLAHFLEHMLFKGTPTKSLLNILNRMEVVGGDLNAYTTKEHTCIHASFLSEHTDRAIELFSDLLFNSTFPEKEILKEKEVIIDEIDSYLDTPEEAIQDEFENIIFKNHSLGENILGSKKSVRNINRKDLISFTKKNYSAEEMVIGVYGKLNTEDLIDIVENHFGHIKKIKAKEKREKPSKYIAETREIKKSINQSHAVIGNRTISIHHKQKNAMSLLSNYLGGPGMSSRLNLELREKKGICYSIDANYIGMSDTGLFTIYMGTDIGKMEKCISLVEKELKILREKKLSTLNLNLAKRKFIGQISLAEENHLSVIIALSRSVLDYGKADSLTQIYKKIESVKAEDLQELANDVFNENQISKLIYLPE